MSDEDRIERIMDRMTDAHSAAQSTIDAFFPKFGENPVSAMSWSETLFKAVADKEATARAIKHLLQVGKTKDGGGTFSIADVANIWMTEIRRGVTRVSCRNTLATANLMEDRLLQASEMILQIVNEEI